MKNCQPRLAKCSVWLFVGMFLLAIHAKAQKPFMVEECVQYAFQHNPLLNAESTDTAIAKIGVQRIKGIYMPRATFASAMQYYISNRKLLIEGGTALAPPSLPAGDPKAVNIGYNNTWYPTFSVNQLIFDPAYRNNYNLALQNQKLQAQQLTSFRIDVVSGIYRAFNTCRLLEVQARFLTENIIRIDTLISLTRTKFTAGAGIKLEVNRVEVTGNRMKSELVNVQNAYSEALLALQFQMNYLEKDSMILAGPFAVELVTGKVDSVLQRLLQSQPSHRIETQLLQTQIAMADESIKLEQSRQLPVVGADGALGFTPAANSMSKFFQGERWKPYSYIGINVGVPLFNGMDVKRAVQQRKLQASQSRDYMDQFTTQFETERSVTYTQLKNANDRYKLADTNLKLANNNIELLHEAFINGVADNQDLILGENDLYENQARYYNELLQLLLIEIEGMRVTGSFNNIATQ